MEENKVELCGEDSEYTPLTLDEAIEHANDVAERSCSSCAKEHKQLADWLTELKEIRTKNQYLVAEFDNYRKRMEKQRLNMIHTATEDVVRDILPIVDDVERTLEACSSVEVKDSVETAVAIIYKRLITLLEDEGCEKIKCSIGDTFNVEYHEAVSSVDATDEFPQDTITNIIQNGWSYNGKIIRHTKVVVSV